MSKYLDLAFFILLASAALIAAVAWILRPWLYSLTLSNDACNQVRRERDELADVVDAIRVELDVTTAEADTDIYEHQHTACAAFVGRVADILKR